MKRAFRIVGILFIVVFVGGGLLAANFLVPKKAFTVSRVGVDAILDGAGTMRVVEHITYDFTGKFSYGTRPIPSGPYVISDMTVSERGTALVSTGAPNNLQWYFTAQDETRTFDIAYTVAGAAVGAPDVDALYWKWVGTEHPTIGTVKATLHVPAGAGVLKAWGHGPLTGNVTVGADTVTWVASDVPTGTWVEGRVVIPATRLPAVVPSAPDQLSRILAEEDAWSRAANDTRSKAARDAQRTRDARNTLNVATPIVTILGVFAFLRLWRRYGKEPDPPQPVGEYVRDLPDDPPAVVVALMNWGAISPAAFSATILDLAQRGFLTVREVKIDRALLADRTDYEMTATDGNPSTLKAFERTALEQVFASGSPVMQSEIAKYSRAHQTESLARWNSFKADAATSLRSRKYINGHRSKPFLLNIAAAVVVGLIGFGAIGVKAWVVGGIAIGWAGLALALTPLLRQRSPEGTQRFLEWKGVQKYLHDFSLSPTRPSAT